MLLFFVYFCQFYGKRTSTKFSRVLIFFGEGMELQSFQLSASDVIPAAVLNILPLLFCIFLSMLWKENFLEILMAFLIICREVMKLRSLE